MQHAVGVRGSLHLRVAGPRPRVGELLLGRRLAAIIVGIADLMLRGRWRPTSERTLPGAADRNRAWRVSGVVERLFSDGVSVRHLEKS